MAYELLALTKFMSIGQEKVVLWLLIKGADARIKNNQGLGPRDIAVKNGRFFWNELILSAFTRFNYI